MSIEDFPISESARRMIDMVTKGFYDRSYVAKWLYQVMGEEMDSLYAMMEDLPKQIFPETATWALMFHEQKWGLPVRTNLSDDERRLRILQKRDYRAPMTPYKMEKYLEDATGFEVHVEDVNDLGRYGFEAPHPNVFKVYFVGEGAPDLRLACSILDLLKQSHTCYILNDRLEVEMDNQNLGRVVFEKACFRMSLPFWYVHEYTLDGSWPLDGSVLLHTRKSYQLMVGIKFCQDLFFSPQQFGLAGAGIMAGIRVKERMDVGTNHGTGIHSVFKDKASMFVQAESQSVKEAVGLTVETKSKDRWFLDGTVLLDGSRSLDSIYEVEEIE